MYNIDSNALCQSDTCKSKINNLKYQFAQSIFHIHVQYLEFANNFQNGILPTDKYYENKQKLRYKHVYKESKKQKTKTKTSQRNME